MTLPNATFIHSQIVNYYKVFQDWSKSIIAKAMQRGYFLTKYGWKYWISPNEKINPRRLINWPIQSHGSEILRRAIIDLDEAGFEISMIIHDAVLIHMKRKGSAKNIKKLKTIMSDAAEKVIGAAIPVDTNIIRKQFNQDGEHKERWEKLYEKLEWTKNKQVSNSDIVYSKQPPVVFNKYI